MNIGETKKMIKLLEVEGVSRLMFLLLQWYEGQSSDEVHSPAAYAEVIAAFKAYLRSCIPREKKVVQKDLETEIAEVLQEQHKTNRDGES